MNNVYEIEYEMLGDFYTNYVVAKSLKELYIWLEKNAKWEIIEIKYLGHCIKILVDDNGK